MRCAASPGIWIRRSRHLTTRSTSPAPTHSDPVLSPIYADLHGLPPTLFITSGRDLLLSGTVNLHRAYLNAGVDARLVVFDALPMPSGTTPRCPRRLKPTT